MFHLDWTEILLIAAVAVLFVGPRELLLALGRGGVAIARMMRGLQRGASEMMDDAERRESAGPTWTTIGVLFVIAVAALLFSTNLSSLAAG